MGEGNQSDHLSLWRINGFDRWLEVAALVFFLFCRILAVVGHWRSTKWVTTRFKKALSQKSPSMLSHRLKSN